MIPCPIGSGCAQRDPSQSLNYLCRRNCAGSWRAAYHVSSFQQTHFGSTVHIRRPLFCCRSVVVQIRPGRMYKWFIPWRPLISFKSRVPLLRSNDGLILHSCSNRISARLNAVHSVPRLSIRLETLSVVLGWAFLELCRSCGYHQSVPIAFSSCSFSP